MRKLLMSLAAAVTTVLIATPSANAASRWTCEGSELVCGPASPAVTKSPSYDDASEATTKRATRTARARHHAETASLSDDDGKPVRRRARHQASASVASDDDAPVRRRRARNSEGGGGGGESFSGKASYYWEPQALASGGRFNPNAMTAAHKTLPFGTRVRVTNQHNGQSVDVIINDRGPYVAGRVIDLSKAAAQSINMTGSGVVPVSVKVLGRG